LPLNGKPEYKSAIDLSGKSAVANNTFDNAAGAGLDIGSIDRARAADAAFWGQTPLPVPAGDAGHGRDGDRLFTRVAAMIVAMTGVNRYVAYCAYRIVALAVGASLLGAPLAGAQTSTVKIAVPTALTGSGQFVGRALLEAVQFAVEESNATGEAPRIELDVVDDRSNAEGAREAARQIAARDALVVVGPSLTGSALAAGPIYAEAGLASLPPTAQGDAITNNATSFRTMISASEMGDALANYLHYVVGGTRAVVLYLDNSYGRPFADGFKRVAGRRGIATTYHRFSQAAEGDEAARLAASDPAQPAIFLGMTYEDAVPLLVSLRRQGTKGTIFGTASLALAGFADLFKDQPEYRQNPSFFTEGVYAASPVIFDSTNARTLEFAQRYRVRFGREPSWEAVQSFDTARLAIAAIRAVLATPSALAPDLKARREAVRAYLASLDPPAHAVTGLTGPLWFRPDRSRPQAVRVGRYHDTLFESAPLQLVPVSNADPAEIAAGTVVDVGSGGFARRQQVVYTGIFLNEIPRIDIPQSTFTADFYLWMRSAPSNGAAGSDPTEIDFPDLVRGSFDGKRPIAQRELGDGTTYRLWRMHGEFKNDYDLHRYPADRQTLVVRFFNSRAASDRLVYVIDRRSFDAGAGTALAKIGESSSNFDNALAGQAAQAPSDTRLADAFAGAVAPAALRNLSQWEPVRADQRRDNLVTNSALGDPGLVGLERVRELSGFSLTIDLKRRIIVTLAKTLLPLGLMALIMFASLYFPSALATAKVSVAITGALSGVVLLSLVNSQLGNVGYLVAIEYGFYVFFVLCLLCIIAVLSSERLRVAGRESIAVAIEQTARYLFLLGMVGTAATGWIAYSRW
jgi:branched-chain amino acid transport system substrate-binding protein